MWIYTDVYSIRIQVRLARNREDARSVMVVFYFGNHIKIKIKIKDYSGSGNAV